MLNDGMPWSAFMKVSWVRSIAASSLLVIASSIRYTRR